MSLSGVTRQGVQARLAATILIAVMLGMLCVSWATQQVFQSGLSPALQGKAAVVGASVGELIGKALDHGLELPELVGVPEHLEQLRHEHPELAHLQVNDAAGAALFSSGQAESAPRVDVPIVHQGRRVGAIQAQVSSAYIRHVLLESALDLGVVFIVAMFLTRELLHAISSAELRAELSAQPGSGPAARPVDAAVLASLRIPLFLFMLAEEMTRAFLPAYAHSLMPRDAPISPELLVGLPIVAFMLVVALGQPLLASWSERAGHRRAMLWGAALGVVGLAGSALAWGLADFIAWRGLCGLGYAMVFVAGQGLVIEHTGPAQRTRGFALFVGAIMVAAVCGPPIGAMLADHAGPRLGFAAAAAMAAVAGWTVRSLPRVDASTQSSNRAPTLRDFLRLFEQGRFVWITTLAALPAKLILAAFCFYLVPIYLVSEGASLSVAGRAMMIYAVVLVLVMPQSTRLVERGVPLARLVGLGLCISSLGGFALLAWRGAQPVYLAMALLGLGQGLSIAAQSSLLAQVCAAEIATHGSGPVFGVYRLVERLGNTSGPIVAAALAASVGQAHAFAAIASLVLSCGLVFLLIARAVSRSVAP